MLCDKRMITSTLAIKRRGMIMVADHGEVATVMEVMETIMEVMVIIMEVMVIITVVMVTITVVRMEIVTTVDMVIQTDLDGGTVIPAMVADNLGDDSRKEMEAVGNI
eukprot:NODE_63_length_25098_cov_0.440498.p19 type:complete len:107 gc:universal NODE_63_length_25098_cov_0.440498:17307-16987(-)